MFFTYCKDTGCVLIKGTEHPAKVFTLIDNFDEHFNIVELDVNQNDYYGKVVKIQDNSAIIVGPMTEENMKVLCGDCPNPLK
jgi:hypothetical protein